MAAERYVLGIDVGGTFTDLALVRLSDGGAFYHKLSSTPEEPSLAVAKGIEELLATTAVAVDAITYFGHGTTVATNAVIMGKFGRTGLITSEGFRDILEIRRQRQPHLYDIRLPKPAPAVPRHRRREVRERTFLYGFDSVPPEEADLEPILADFEREKVEGVAICFLHSYENPEHEKQVAEWVRRRLPNVFVCASHEVIAEFREFERVSTTVLNASLGPVMSRYLRRLSADAGNIGIVAPRILQSHGGVASPEDAAALPVRTLASGPAAGVTGAAYLAAKAGFSDIISFDVGGTSTDVSLIAGGNPVIAKEREVGGYPLRFPMLDIHSAGAGGGSIAWVDSGGFLHVGPRSAGANPGPACYDLGGSEPTVTDANVVLGRLHQDALLGGRMPIRAKLAHRAIEEKVAGPMGLSTEEAAQGILTILNEKMLQVVRVISVEQGFDPRTFTLVAFGGAGPLLASQLARELGIATVVVPVSPGMLCALGLLVADLRSDFSLTRIMNMEDSGADRLNDAFAEIEGEARAWFERERITAKRQRIDRAIDMRYVGQSHELTIAVQTKALADGDFASISAAFRKEHERVYGYATEAPVQFVTFRVTTSAQVTPPPVMRPPEIGRDLSSALRGKRKVYFKESVGYKDCPVYERAMFPTGTVIDGPAIFEQMDTTTVVLPGQQACCDEHGNLILTFA